MRLLYLAYHFPPAPAIGAVRAWNTAKWLAALGWEVTVVTPEPSVWLDAEAAPAPPPGVRLLHTGHRWPMLAPEQVRWLPGTTGWLLGGVCRVVARQLGAEAGSGWALSAEQACAGLARGSFDLILATGGPYASFALARRLSRRLGCPYALDYRDPWTGNPHDPRRAEPSREEAELLAAASAVTVVSPSWARLIGGTFGVAGKTHVVTNGFDPEMFAAVEPERFGHFAVVYAGTLYPPKRVLGPVLEAFAASGVPGKLHYYGNYAERLRPSERLVVHGRVPRAQALSAQKGADLLVVVASVEEEGTLAERGTVTGKVFDCMALDRPALIVAPRDSDLNVVAETAGGMRCFTGSDVEGMARYIRDVAAGRVPAALDRAAYRWDRIAVGLDRALRQEQAA